MLERPEPMQNTQKVELSDWYEFGMPVADLLWVVARRPDRGDGFRRTEVAASFVVISMYEHALAVVLLHRSLIS